MRWLVVGGLLLVGAVLGFGGNFVEQPNLRSLMYTLSAAGRILASVLLAIELATNGHRLAAGGFALLALGETRVLNPVDAPGGEGSFAVGVLLYAPGLLMIAFSSWAPLWVRLLGAIAAVLFAMHALILLGGGEVDSQGPIAGIGYGILTLTVIGWIIAVLRPTRGRRLDSLPELTFRDHYKPAVDRCRVRPSVDALPDT